MTNINFSKFELLNAEIAEIYRKYLTVSEQDSYYAEVGNRLLNNRVNSFVNFQNFKEIFSFFQNSKDLRVCDLGCGFGDKALVLKKIFPSFSVFGIETVNHDDPDHKEHKPHIFFESIFKSINKEFDVQLSMYDGVNIDFSDEYFDVILLYAVIEHVAPEKRTAFIDAVSNKLKRGGYFVITRCPRYLGLMEFLSRKLKLGAHEWVLKRHDLLDLFPDSAYSVEVLKRMNNIPNNYQVAKYFSGSLILLDLILSLLHWPFSTDYFLIVKKR